MGTSTDAILGWGVAYEEEIYDESDGEDGGWSAVLAAELEVLGVEAGEHCSNECPQPYVFITESVQRASRGDVVDVKLRKPGADWRKRINKAVALLAKRFEESDDLDATAYDFATDQPQGWKLVSWWC